MQLQCEGQSQSLTPLPMGWALKTIAKKVRFTQKQTDFLKQQFEFGEQSGRKADSNEVSKFDEVCKGRVWSSSLVDFNQKKF